MTRRSSVELEVVATPAALALLRPAWDRLASAHARTPFGLPAFFDAWCDAFGPARVGFVVVARVAGELRFVLPLWHPREDPAAWASLGAFRADYTDAVLASNDLSIGRAFWQWLVRHAPCRSAKIARLPGISVLARAALTRDDPRADAVRNVLARRRVRYLSTGTQREHPFADRAQVHAMAGRLHTRHTRRNLAMLAKSGEVAYEVRRGAAELAPLLPAFFAMHIANFAGTGRTSQFVDPAERAFYTALAMHPALGTTVELDVLTVAGTPVALHLGFEHRRTIYWYKPTFDLAHGKASPGKSMLAYVFARADAADLEAIDLLKGLEAYKDEWANDNRLTATTTLIDRPLGELATAAVQRWRGRA